MMEGNKLDQAYLQFLSRGGKPIPYAVTCKCVPSGMCHSHTLLGCPHRHFYNDKNVWTCDLQAEGLGPGAPAGGR